MTNKLANELKKLINFGFTKKVDLSKPENKHQMTMFRKNISVEKCILLFQKIEEYLLDDSYTIQEKELIINLTMEFIRDFSNLEKDVSKMPSLIIKIYNSHLKLFDLKIVLDVLSYNEVFQPKEFEIFISKYFDYLDNPDNEFYIHNNYKNIKEFNDKIQKYLNKKDVDGKKNKENLNNSNLLNLITQRIEEFNSLKIN